MYRYINKIKRIIGSMKKRAGRKELFESFQLDDSSGQLDDKMRIILIRPPFVSLRYGPPIGLAYLQDILKRNGHKVLVWDMNQEIDKYFLGLGD